MIFARSLLETLKRKKHRQKFHHLFFELIVIKRKHRNHWLSVHSVYLTLKYSWLRSLILWLLWSSTIFNLQLYLQDSCSKPVVETQSYCRRSSYLAKFKQRPVWNIFVHRYFPSAFSRFIGLKLAKLGDCRYFCLENMEILTYNKKS